MQESGGLQLGRDLLSSLIDVGGLAGARAHELAGAEQQGDHLWLVDAVIREREDEFTKSDQWRLLKLRTLINKVGFDNE